MSGQSHSADIWVLGLALHGPGLKHQITATHALMADVNRLSIT